MSAAQKSVFVAFAVAAVTAIAETAEKLAPNYAGTEWAFLLKVVVYAAGAVKLYLIQQPPVKPPETKE